MKKCVSVRLLTLIVALVVMVAFAGCGAQETKGNAAVSDETFEIRISACKDRKSVV